MTSGSRGHGSQGIGRYLGFLDAANYVEGLAFIAGDFRGVFGQECPDFFVADSRICIPSLILYRLRCRRKRRQQAMDAGYLRFPQFAIARQGLQNPA